LKSDVKGNLRFQMEDQRALIALRQTCVLHEWLKCRWEREKEHLVSSCIDFCDIVTFYQSAWSTSEFNPSNKPRSLEFRDIPWSRIRDMSSYPLSSTMSLFVAESIVTREISFQNATIDFTSFVTRCRDLSHYASYSKISPHLRSFNPG
jgi:hypothetical protein